MADVRKDKVRMKNIQESVLRLLAAANELDESGVAIFDTNGTIEYLNPAFEKLSGQARIKMIGREIPGLPDSSPGEGIFQLMRKSIGRENAKSARLTTR